MEGKKKKSNAVKTLIGVILLIGVVIFWAVEGNKAPNLIDELHSPGHPEHDIAELLVSEEYDDKIYFCTGTTVSDEIFVGYIQVKKGVLTNPKELTYFPSDPLPETEYQIMKKTPEEGAFVFGFVEDEEINQVTVNDKTLDVRRFKCSDGKTFGIWFMKTDYDFSVQKVTRLK